MKYLARIEVGLKPGHSDPEGETTKQSLLELNYPVKAVYVSKVYEIHIDVRDASEAERIVNDMCRGLLANPVKDNYSFRITKC